MVSAAVFSVSTGSLAEDRLILRQKPNPDATDFSEGISYNAGHRAIQKNVEQCIVLNA